MKLKRITALILAGALSVTVLTGCGINKDQVAATMKDQNVTLGVANFMCRYQQAMLEDQYKMYLGAEDIWSQSLGGDATMEDNVKDSAMEQLHEMYTLKAHMADYKIELTDEDKKAVKDAAKKFIEANSQATLNEISADAEIVEEVLTLYTIQSKMRNAIEAEADMNVSDADANMRGYSMVTISTAAHTDEDGNQTEYTDEEKKKLKEDAEKMASELKEAGANLDTVASKYGHEVTSGTYGTDDTQLAEEVRKELDALKEGETSGLIETEGALYFVRLDKETDKEATEQHRQTIINTRKSDKYQEVLSGWQEKDGWKVKEKALEKIVFKNSLTQTDPDAPAETTDGTQQ